MVNKKLETLVYRFTKKSSLDLPLYSLPAKPFHVAPFMYQLIQQDASFLVKESSY